MITFEAISQIDELSYIQCIKGQLVVGKPNQKGHVKFRIPESGNRVGPLGSIMRWGGFANEPLLILTWVFIGRKDLRVKEGPVDMPGKVFLKV